MRRILWGNQEKFFKSQSIRKAFLEYTRKMIWR